MRDALWFSGILLAIVLLTQFGRHRLTPIRSVLAFGGLAIGVKYLADLRPTEPNLLTAAVGAVIGVGLGFAAAATVRVERDERTTHLYTVAGLPYLGIWLAVLAGRLAFVWAMQNVDSFRRAVGRFVVDNGIDQGGVAAFFVLMALAMIVVRTACVLVKAARQPSLVSMRAAASE